MNPTEVQMNRRMTAAFIDANPIDVTLVPRVAVKTGTGTTLQDQFPRPSQTFRLIDQSAVGGTTPGTVVGTDGRQHKVEFQLLGNYDAMLAKYDYWVDSDGVRLEVAELLPDNGYERRAQVVRYG